jgi:hypothetical protein
MPAALEWACLNCEPAWAEVHRMSIEEESLQLAKLEAVLAKDFEAAAAFLNRQDGIEDRIIELVRRIEGPT